MKDTLLIFAFIALTFFCWGAYGPVLHNGQSAMMGSRLRPLLCVGLAYFVIAVIVPIAVLATTGEKGEFTFSGTVWSLLGGSLGAIGALGIILAVSYGGKPSYVMPMVFGFAPLVNAFFTVFLSRAYKSMNALSLGGMMAGLIMVSIGAFLVLYCAGMRGGAHGPAPATSAPTESTSHT